MKHLALVVPKLFESVAGARRAGWRTAANLLVVGCLAAGLRFPGLGEPALWVDECYTIKTSLRVREASLERLAVAVSKGMSTYHILLAPWIQPDISESAVRIPSAIAGSLLCLVLVLIGRQLGGLRFGWCLGLAGAISPFLIWHSREARWYPITWLLVAVALWCYVNARRQADHRWTFGCLVAGFAAATTFAPAATIPLLQAFDLIRRSDTRESLVRVWRVSSLSRKAISILVVCTLFGVALLWTWLTVVAPPLSGGPRGYGFTNVRGVRWPAVGYTALAFSTGYSVGPGPSEWHTLRLDAHSPVEMGLLALALVSAAVLAVRGALALRQVADPSLVRALGVLTLLPPAVIVLACAWTGHTYAPRYAGVSYPFFLCFIAASLAHGPTRAKVWPVACVLLLLQSFSLWNLHANPRYHREDVRAAAQYISERARPDELVLVLGGILEPWKHYYRGDVPWKLAGTVGAKESSIVDLDLDHAAREGVWTVQGRTWEASGIEEALSSLEAWGGAAERQVYAGGVVVTHYLKMH